MSAFGSLRVLDFSQGVAGPMASMLLGDFAAEVVKVEPPAGDRAKDHPGYHAFNRNKQVRTLDLETEAGLVEARRDGKWMHYRLKKLESGQEKILSETLLCLEKDAPVKKAAQRLKQIQCCPSKYGIPPVGSKREKCEA